MTKRDQPAPETFVLIVGGGPVGLSAAIDLGWRGVPTMLVTENLDTAQHPKCNSTNARSMEHFRRLGIASDLRSEGLPPTLERASAYVTRFCGVEFGRLPRAQTDWPTPEPPNIVSQMVLERALRRHAERLLPGAIHFGWKLTSFAADSGGVTAQLADTRSGETRSIHARYLIAADGASSPIRRTLGIAMTGEDGSEHRAFMGGTMLSTYIRAPQLNAASGRRPAHMTYIINPEIRAMMFAQDADERWVVHYQVPKGVDPRSVDVPAAITAMLGADVAFEILSGGPWTGGLALVAERYRDGPVFLAGDAAHLFTPLGGLGMNAGIGDVMNLSWKLAACRGGWAGDGLLDTYETERKPIGRRNAQLGVFCTKVMDRWTLPPDFEADTPEMKEWRARFGERVVEEDKPQYLTVGLQLGERYEDSAAVAGENTPAPPDSWDRYEPSDRPGGRAPHVWPAHKHALFDDFGPGFTLLDFGAAQEAERLSEAASKRGVPLKVVTLTQPANGPYTASLVLVRPDGHVAWRGETAGDALALLDVARGATMPAREKASAA